MNKTSFWQIRFENPRAMIALVILPMVTMISIVLNIQATLDYFKYTKWPNTKGIILETRIDHREYFAKGQTRHQYRPRINYKYTVNGQSFTNNVVNPFLPGGVMKKEEASRLIEKYTVNRDVDIYYSKDNPQLSILEKHMPSRTKFGYLMTLILLFATIALFMSLEKWEENLSTKKPV